MINEKLSDSILSLFSGHSSVLKLNEIAKALKIKSNSSEYEELKETLSFLVNNSVLEKSTRRRYSLPQDYSQKFEGIFLYKNGKSFVETKSDEYPILKVNKEDSSTALDGDRVLVEIKRSKNRKIIGKIIEILERSNHFPIGVIDFDGANTYIVPINKKYPLDFIILDNDYSKYHGRKAKTKFVKWNNSGLSPVVEILEVLDDNDEIKEKLNQTVLDFNLDPTFNNEILLELKEIKKPRNQNTYRNRLDIRDKLVVTIDPEDAKDFDDALSLEILENGNYNVGVHIADVSHYIKENSELDIEARKRGNSTYLVDRVIPMLPEEISNVICSLNPNVPRFSYSIFMELNDNYKVVNYKVQETVINSKRRYNYDEVLEILEAGKGENFELLNNLNSIAKKLRIKRFKSGGIEFDTKELRFKLDEKRVPYESYLKGSNTATQLVEEFMLLANKTVAKDFENLSKKLKLSKILPTVYRVHEQADTKIINETLEFISSLSDKKYKKITDVSSGNINNILRQFKNTIYDNVVNQVLIRSMPKAIYSQTNIGHYGLGFSDYVHFTSPIRRYADLIIHRLHKEYTLLESDLKQGRKKYLQQFVKSISKHISDTERKSMEAERASSKIAQVAIARNKVGEEFIGTITGVTNFGLFLILDQIFVEGLLHIKDLKDDYYVYDEKKIRIYGRRKKVEFRLGQRIRVKIARANLSKSNIDFEFLEKI